MTVESGVFTILSTDADLAAAAEVSLDLLSGIVLRSGAVVDPPDRWLAVRWEEPTLTGRVGTYGFTLRAHDRDQTYAWITDVLEAAKSTLTAVVHQHGITQIDWRGRSPDLLDDGYRTLTKFDTYVAAAGLTTRKES